MKPRFFTEVQYLSLKAEKFWNLQQLSGLSEMKKGCHHGSTGREKEKKKSKQVTELPANLSAEQRRECGV